MGSLGDSGYCMRWGGSMMKIVHTLPGASECLQLVREVSERCLGVVCVTLDTGWGV